MAKTFSFVFLLVTLSRTGIVTGLCKLDLVSRHLSLCFQKGILKMKPEKKTVNAFFEHPSSE